MKRIIILQFGFAIITFGTFAQSPAEMAKERQEKYQAELKEYNIGIVDTSHRFIYKTYEDFVAGKPATEIKYTGKRKILMDSESVLVAEDNDFVYKKVKDLKYWGFVDEWGQIERIFNNHCYYALDTGRICSYLKAIDVEMKTDKAGKITFNWLTDNMSATKEYLSEGLKGGIDAFSEKKFQDMTFDEPAVYDQFKKEPLNTKVKEVRTERALKLKKYTQMYNSKYY